MRFFKRVFWILAFAIVTFFWTVAFQHGFTPAALSKGAREEISTLFQLVSGGKNT
jgi:hypothetical protein